ncbi:MAG: asparagine--tRNA ligase [Sedimentibacter sp.]|uniref:asparagine--tRNA ligase n=1 Tax=Sedimentibacter sp. TaxID=1960295 RepID=UPI0029815CED|nr:asparagine--tRNA ligase [Sedimentibacter sp.]MDW5299059.1 asparagine--tRNA ligase [Sedimentibacter sp.]
MKSIDLRDLFKSPEKYYEKEVLVEGWIRTIRDSKNFGFIELNDGTFMKNVQVVFENNLSNFEEVKKFSTGSAITVKGILIMTPEAKQLFEINAVEIAMEAESDSSYPLQKKRHSLEYLRTIAHLRPRTNTFSAVFRVRSLAAFTIHKFFNERSFVYAHPPIITASDAEGAGEMFRVTALDLDNIEKTGGKTDYSKDFFGKSANLTVSGQLEAEIFALAYKKTYTFGPTFRAENSNTTRHAAEFWMIEPEIAFADINDNMQLAEDMVKYVVSYVLENEKEEMEFFNSFVEKDLFAKLDNVISSEFGRISYTDAIDILMKNNDKFDYPVHWGTDIQTEHERYLSEQIFKKPVFVINYPKEIKAFYMRMNEDNKTVAAMDLLVPGIGELIGGSQREERLDLLEKRMGEMGVGKEDMWWYLELRKYGGVKHAGYGLGFERLIMYLTGMGNIRDVIPFPRTPKNAEF